MFKLVISLNAVSKYLNNVLKPTLLKYGTSESFVQYAVETVEMQMNSLLRHWDDIKFRNTILLLGLEEGSFYEPAVKLDVRCFVVVTLRNSPIEVIQSEACTNVGLNQLLTNQEVKDITFTAVRYFSQQNFEEMSKQAQNTHLRDIYGELHEKYPVAWLSMQTVATRNSKMVDYPKQSGILPYAIDENFGDCSQENEKAQVISVVLDGYNPTIDLEMMKMLNRIEATNGYLITDSFKSLTRNVEKLFRIIEFLLTRGLPLVTTNFYLEDGHVEKRMKPLRAAHTWQEMNKNLSQTLGLGYRHRQALNEQLNNDKQ